MRLDARDRKILAGLDRNARQPLSRIAKRARLSREAVLYRLRKYRSEGIIRGFLAVVDVGKLGFTHHKVFVKLHNISELQEKALISAIVRNPHVSWLASCDGAYSLIFAVKARSSAELDSIMKDIRNRFWRFFMDTDITTIVSARHFYRSYLSGEKSAAERAIELGRQMKAEELDEADVQILDAVAKNPRASAVEIAARLRMSPDAVIRRIKKMEQSGVIKYYTIWPDVARLKGMFYKVLISFNNLNEENEKKIISYCRQNPNIVYAVNVLGPWQFEMDVEVSSVQEFRSLMRGFLNTFAGIVKDYTALNIYEEHKFRFFEKEALEKMKKNNG